MKALRTTEILEIIQWETMRQILAEKEEKKKMDPGHHAAWIARLVGNK